MDRNIIYLIYKLLFVSELGRTLPSNLNNNVDMNWTEIWMQQSHNMYTVKLLAVSQ